MNLDFSGLEELIGEIDKIEGMTSTLKDQALREGGEVLRSKLQDEVYSHGLDKRTGTAQESIAMTEPKDGTVFVGTKGGAKRPGFYLYMHEVGYYNVSKGAFIAPLALMSIVYESNKNNILDAYVGVFKRGLGM